jgi:hypothetical protein
MPTKAARYRVWYIGVLLPILLVTYVPATALGRVHLLCGS